MRRIRHGDRDRTRPWTTGPAPGVDAPGTRVRAGDNVSLELSPYDLSKGRITFRHLERRGPVMAPRGPRR